MMTSPPMITEVIRKTFVKIFVSCIDAEFVENRYGSDAENHHCYRQAKIKLYKSHPVRIRLTRSRCEGNGACLRRHNCECNRIPLHRLICQQKALDVSASSSFPHPIEDDEEEGRCKHNPVELSHLNASEKK